MRAPGAFSLTNGHRRRFRQAKEQEQGRTKIPTVAEVKLVTDHPERALYRNSLAHSYHNRGMLLRSLNRLEDAEAEIRAALAWAALRPRSDFQKSLSKMEARQAKGK